MCFTPSKTELCYNCSSFKNEAINSENHFGFCEAHAMYCHAGHYCPSWSKRDESSSCAGGGMRMITSIIEGDRGPNVRES